VVASGEQVTSGLLAIALQDIGIPARSWQGWQIPIMTDDAHGSARIRTSTGRDDRGFNGAQVAVVAGFQGMPSRRPHHHAGPRRLGHVAVALAAAIKADRCDIYTDVDGVYTTDPRVVPKARGWTRSPSRKCWNGVAGRQGAANPLVELGMVHKVRCSCAPASTSRRYRSAPDAAGHADLQTRRKSWKSRSSPASPFRRTKRRSRCAASRTSRASPRRSSAARRSQHQCRHDRAERLRRRHTTDITFTVPPNTTCAAHRTTITKAKDEIGYNRDSSATDVAKVSVIGDRHAQPRRRRAQAFKALAERKGINIRAITTSEIKFSLLIDAGLYRTGRPHPAHRSTAWTPPDLITMHPQLDDLVRVCIEAKVSHVVLAGGIPPGSAVRAVKDGGAKLIAFAPALVLAKRLVRSGADAIIIEGSEAGGHIGPVSLTVLAQEILPHLRDVPVFVAGGIGRGEAILSYLEMGASGAQLGTRFAACAESIAHANFKKAFLRANARDALPSIQLDERFPVIPVQGSMFFFEKKNQKTFIRLASVHASSPGTAKTDKKSFCFFFFRKRRIFLRGGGGRDGGHAGRRAAGRQRA
jgi:NAD(P)H-dependent flavin oxidoreductase YrpB (nitropropane dioxygenase family)